MSERGSGVGPFLLGVALGAAVGMLFAPEAGAAARGKLGRRAKVLRDGALETVDDLRGLLTAGAGPGEDADETPARSSREELRERLAEARRRRRGKGSARLAGTEAAEEDEPVA
ncbi:MAG TPA: YtxH domain-containing protein [Gemmatimonadales bacterium]